LRYYEPEATARSAHRQALLRTKGGGSTKMGAARLTKLISLSRVKRIRP
jgi:hypothetical protein